MGLPKQMILNHVCIPLVHAAIANTSKLVAEVDYKEEEEGGRIRVVLGRARGDRS